MGLDVFWHSEMPDLTGWNSLQRTVVEAFSDEDDILMNTVSALPRENYPVLFGIDLYGDTILSPRQCETARSELREIQEWKENQQLVRLDALLGKCIQAPGTCVQISGD
ncbi:hypothetical protein [Kitasatospora indigofera]|uniref:hypothetical protein n=1 Tax=Kitasatospora indigofera TaxID=67307 RepID=UPI00324D0D4C